MSELQLPVLIVDDQPAVVRALSVLFELNDLHSHGAASPEEALRLAANETFGAVVQDMNFSRNETAGAEGVELFRALQETQPGVPVVLMTAWASLETAVKLVKEGAADYFEKPWDDDKLVSTVRNLVRLRELEIENQRMRSERTASREALKREYDLCGVVFASEAMQRLISLAVNVARSDAAVLMTGPSGSGKEKLAEIVQANSRRRKQAFVRVNVGTIPEELAEAELFGAEAGAYTGIEKRRAGHFESAAGGTLFLDEIDSLSHAVQVKLLRVLQTGEFQRLGSSKTHHVDVRVLSATNADLEQALESGRLRDDLLYRLNVVELEIPGLAERRDDILPLAEHFLERFCGERSMSLSREARSVLSQHDWPGNVRELENRIQRATVVAAGDEISAGDLGFDRERGTADAATSVHLQDQEIVERERLLAALSRVDGVVAHAAKDLGISRQALYRKMARLGIEIERRPRP